MVWCGPDGHANKRSEWLGTDFMIWYLTFWPRMSCRFSGKQSCVPRDVNEC